jgi:hypothetical protein
MYKVDTKIFNNVEDAIAYANWISKISGLILAVEKV